MYEHGTSLNKGKSGHRESSYFCPISINWNKKSWLPTDSFPIPFRKTHADFICVKFKQKSLLLFILCLFIWIFLWKGKIKKDPSLRRVTSSYNPSLYDGYLISFKVKFKSSQGFSQINTSNPNLFAIKSNSKFP